MRTTGERATRAVALFSIAILAAACAGGPSTSAGTQPASEPLRPTEPVLTPVPSAPPASPQPTPIAFLDADVLEANVTPWPVSSVSAGRNICAVGTDERLRCWAPAGEVPKGAFTTVAAGDGTSCGIRTDGTVTCWGEVALHAPKGRFRTLSVEQEYACGIRTDGTAHCWWSDVTDDDVTKPAADDPELPDGRYTDISVGMDTGGCALREDGSIACWASEFDTPAQPSGRYIDLGDSCGVRSTGEIECFGDSEWSEDGPAPELPSGPFVAMDGSRYRGCALRARGTLICWGNAGWDDEGNGRPMPTPPGTYTAVTVGEDNACALRPDSHAVCWGENNGVARPAPTTHLQMTPFVTGNEIDASWRAVPVSAPITGYDVEYTTSDVGAEDAAGNPIQPAWVRWFSGTGETSGTLSGEAGSVYCVRARAHDADGMVSDWSPSEYCTAVPIDERTLRATGPWEPVDGDVYFEHTALMTTTRGATLLISQNDVDGVVIMGTTCAGCGTFILRSPEEDCWEEDEETTTVVPPTCPPREAEIDLRGPRADSAIVYESAGSEEGYSGPIELIVTSSGKPVIIDGVIFAFVE